MGLSIREIRVIESLLRHPEGLTANAIADEIGVSARTVHRDLDTASSFLDSHELTLDRRSGRGLKVEGTDEARERALDALRGINPSGLTPEERRFSLLRVLLGRGEPMKLRAIASRLGVAVGTVTRDLDEVEAWLSDFRLSLLRKPGYGVEVTGAERDLRQAMSFLILRDLDESSAERPDAREPNLIDGESLVKIRAMIGEMAESLPYALADDAVADLGVHVALMVERLSRGKGIELDDDTLRRLRQAVEYAHARQLAEAVEEEFRLDVSEEEVAYITMHLRGAKLRDDEALALYSGDSDLETASRVKALIHYVEDETGVPLAGDGPLYTGLLVHTERAIARLRDDMRIYNPLLSEMKHDYPALFDLVEQGTKKVFADEDFPEEEIGFVAMHFGAALDRGQGSFPRKVLVICSAGIGSSRMLASRLEKAFPQIQFLKNASLPELGSVSPADFDLIVSTVPLDMPEESYVRVQPLLSEEEIERIRTHLRERSRDARLADRAMSESLEVLGGGQEKFHQMAEATQTIADLMDDAFLVNHMAHGSVPEAVRLMCASLAERGLVTDAGSLEAALFTRMELGGIGIPGTDLALFHARNEAVVRPSFSVHGFDEPLDIEGMDGAMMRVRRSLLMAAPLELSPVALEAISEISVAIVERPMEREVLEDGSEAGIIGVLRSIFARYLQNKLS
jgi:mannitol operon transcriptional antiterminator